MDIYIFFSNSKVLSENIFKKVEKVVKENTEETKKILIFPTEITENHDVENWSKENIKSLTGTISSFQLRACVIADNDAKSLYDTIDTIKKDIKRTYPEAIVWTEAIKIFSEIPERNSTIPDEPTFDFVWLISPWNGYVKVAAEDIWNMVILFYYLEFITNKNIAFIKLKEFSKQGTFGMAALDIPFQFLKEEFAEKLAQQMLTKILEVPSQPLKNEGERFWKTEIRDFDFLKNVIRNDVKLDFEEKRKRINLRKGEEGKWADIFNSVYYFFLIKGVEPYRQMIKENYENVSEKIMKAFKKKIDELIEKNINPSSLFSFLSEVYRRTIMDKRKGHTFSVTSSRVQEIIKSVKEKFKTLPFLSSVLLRIITFSFIITFTLYLLIPKILKVEQSPILFAFLGFSSLAFFFPLFFFPFQDKRQDFYNTVIDAEKMIWQAFDEYLDFEAHKLTLRIFSKLESASGSPEALEKDPPLFDREESEYLAIKDYLQKIQSASTSSVVKMPQILFPYINLLEYDAPKIEYEGEIEKDIESCVKEGLHKNWQNSTPETILQQCINFFIKSERVKIKPATISEFLKGLKDELRTNLKNRIIEWSAPYFLHNVLSAKLFFLFSSETIPQEFLPIDIQVFEDKAIKVPTFLTICYEPKKSI